MESPIGMIVMGASCACAGPVPSVTPAHSAAHHPRRAVGADPVLSFAFMYHS